jgi:hypothetical protein
MTRISVGCLLERLPNPRSALLSPRGERPPALAFFEWAPRPPLSTFATLARFRKQLSRDIEVALVAPRSTFQTPRGPMREGPELDAGFDWLARAADILAASAVVIATGNELTPGERDRSLLQKFVLRLRSSAWGQTGKPIVFAPRGLWEPEDAAPFASRLGALYGFDPLEHDAPPGELLYGRVRPMGARPRLTEGHLAQIAERLIRAPRSYVCIESETAVRDMKRLARLLESLEELQEEEETMADPSISTEHEEAEEEQQEEAKEAGDEDEEDSDEEESDEEGEEDGDKEGDEDEDDEDDEEEDEDEEDED